MENREIAIKMTGIKKVYKLGQINGTTLQEALQSYIAKLKKKEDPNSKIGQLQRLDGKRFMALNGIDLTIYKGEAIGIIGSNGAGKSTLLKILSRITAPTEGEVDMYGRVSSMLEVGTGFNREMTGRENIYMNGAILGMTKEEIDAKIEQIIEFSEVREFIDTPVKRYSSGMYVKLAFSVITHLDSDIMIMDEVLAVGDVRFQKKCLKRMAEVSNYENKTILYVSHNMETIRQLCTRCIVLNQGRIIYNGDVENAISVYLEKKGAFEDTYYEYGSEGQAKLLFKDAKILWLHLDNREKPLYDIGDNLVFDMAVWSGKCIENLCFRFELWCADETPVGTAYGLELGKMNKNEKHIFRIKFDATQLVRGKYQVNLILYEEDNFGTPIDYDILLPAFYFELIDSADVFWNDKAWGHIRLPKLICEKKN